MQVLQHFKGNEEFVKRVYDYLDLVDRRYQSILTPFFSSEQASIFEKIVGKQYLYHKSGGFKQAERVRYLIKAYEDDVENMCIVQLQANISKKYSNITHPDILGAIMNLGIEREKIGDLLVLDERIVIFVDETIANYIIANLTKIKKTNVQFAIANEEINYEVKMIEKEMVVSSLRLDVLVSALANCSRSKAQSYIKNKFVKVNQVILEEIAYLCDNDSVISIRGAGRFVFKGILKKTKKDHLVILVEQYQ